MRQIPRKMLLIKKVLIKVKCSWIYLWQDILYLHLLCFCGIIWRIRSRIAWVIVMPFFLASTCLWAWLLLCLKALSFFWGLGLFFIYSIGRIGRGFSWWKITFGIRMRLFFMIEGVNLWKRLLWICEIYMYLLSYECVIL